MIIAVNLFDIPLWCNGNTGDFESPFLGSNPGKGTYGAVDQWQSQQT